MNFFIVRRFLRRNFESRRRWYSRAAVDKKGVEALHDEPKFEKILIANRGEISCRIIKTCRFLGIKTVAVYSEIDVNELHVKLADESICIGPAPASKSYLCIDSILKAVHDSGADAVHPGYGFLSENSNFARKLSETKVAFIGPNFDAIDAMGDKIRSKQIAVQANVSLIPGFNGEILDESHCLSVARQVGYPVMLKASAGGGGKGLRVAWNEKQAREGFRLAKQEASGSFGDDRMLVEKFIDGARHIEMQILCDKHGNNIWLNERECSIQRRNQKIIEEAPSPFIDPATRRKMGEQACALAAAVGYDSAGTVEFLVDSQRNFFFLEMNTRLQVEHPVTEAITGIDLVHQMIRLAYGHKLNLQQDDVKLNGHSVECRVYAEDPRKNFGLPSTGRLRMYEEPVGVPAVRCDSGVNEGSEIGLFYDHLICKVISHGQNRQKSLNLMCDALDRFVLRGVSNNLALLRDVMGEENFVGGNISTDYFAKNFPDGFKGPKMHEKEFRNLAAVAAYVFAYYEKRAMLSVENCPQIYDNTFCIEIPNFVQNTIVRFKVDVRISDDNFKVCIDEMDVNIKGRIDFSKSVFNLNIDGEKFVGQLMNREPSGYLTLHYKGSPIRMKVVPLLAEELGKYMLPKKQADCSKNIISPMPGLIRSVCVQVGQMVTEGQEVCVMEAMKMQNSLAASRCGKVKKVHCQPGHTVDAETVLVELE